MQKASPAPWGKSEGHLQRCSSHKETEPISLSKSTICIAAVKIVAKVESRPPAAEKYAILSMISLWNRLYIIS